MHRHAKRWQHRFGYDEFRNLKPGADVELMREKRQLFLKAYTAALRIDRLPTARRRHPLCASDSHNYSTRMHFKRRKMKRKKAVRKDKERTEERQEPEKASGAPGNATEPSMRLGAASPPAPPYASAQRFFERNWRLFSLRNTTPRKRPPPRDRSAQPTVDCLAKRMRRATILDSPDGEDSMAVE